MVARIAPSPIATSVSNAGPSTAALNPATASTSPQYQSAEHEPVQQQAAAQIPPPPSPPGEAFAAAVLAGQLSPRPVSVQELARRLGSAWQPPSSPLRLMGQERVSLRDVRCRHAAAPRFYLAKMRVQNA